jgi:hypothetical protein
MASNSYFWKTFENNPGIEAVIYRDSLTPLYGPSRCVVDEFRLRNQRPEFVEPTGTANGNDSPTHVIAVEPKIAGVAYKPLLGDKVVINGSTDGLLDGEYVVKEYSLPVLGARGRLDYTQLKVRYLAPKKPGDTAGNNQTVVRPQRWR